MHAENCEKCKKAVALCVCSEIKPQTTRTHVLILQHPQEPDHELGTALLAHHALPNSTLKIGLSWRNLKILLGKNELDLNQWVVLYLGSGIKNEPPQKSPLQFVSKKGMPLEPPKKIKGIILLDGSWSQAKTLWWRNAWLLKLPRAILKPTRPSLYGKLRKEPRRECLSTIESIADTLDALHESPQVSAHLRQLFVCLLEKYRHKK
ncbi:MAG: DTW domain-containing protein [Gammaproteobacteria bacterium]|nr:DTW domain-containing protein [Gammaproteobacteria bacterium]